MLFALSGIEDAPAFESFLSQSVPLSFWEQKTIYTKRRKHSRKINIFPDFSTNNY